MKKWVIIILIVLFCLGGGVSTYFLLHSNAKENLVTDCTQHNYYFYAQKDSAYYYRCLNCGDTYAVNIAFSLGSGKVYPKNQNIVVEPCEENVKIDLSGLFLGSIEFFAEKECNLELNVGNIEIITDYRAPLCFVGKVTAKINLVENCVCTIVDSRTGEVEPNDYNASIFADNNLTVCGKGCLNLSSTLNGVHTKGVFCSSCEDGENENIKLNCLGYAIKGNDGVTILSGKNCFISREDDGIKASSAKLLQSGEILGSVKFLGGETNIYSAYDGVDAGGGVEISGANTQVNVYTNSFSSFTKKDLCFSPLLSRYIVRTRATNFSFSIRYTFFDGTTQWFNSTSYFESVGFESPFYFYVIERPTESFKYLELFCFSETEEQGQSLYYTYKTKTYDERNAQDVIIIDNPLYGREEWNCYVGSSIMGEPNSDLEQANILKSPKSAKGIKCKGFMNIVDATVNVFAYDDGLHLNTLGLVDASDTAILIKNAVVNLSSNDDAIHSEGKVKIVSGEVNITNAYEGIEGSKVQILGGNITVISKDDAINGTDVDACAVAVSGGNIYLYCGGDGLDSNGTMEISGGEIVVFCSSIDESCLDVEKALLVSGDAKVVGIGCANCLYWSHIYNCIDFEDHATFERYVGDCEDGDFVCVKINGETICCVKAPCERSVGVVYLGSNEAEFFILKNMTKKIDNNGVWWYN